MNRRSLPCVTLYATRYIVAAMLGNQILDLSAADKAGIVVSLLL